MTLRQAYGVLINKGCIEAQRGLEVLQEAVIEASDLVVVKRLSQSCRYGFPTYRISNALLLVICRC
jgi:predicted metal-binding protein